MAKIKQAIRWTRFQAAQEFGLDAKTLEKQMKQAGIVPGTDGKFSTMDICTAIFGSLKGDLIRAQTRQATEQAELTAVKKKNLLRENIPAALVERTWAGMIKDFIDQITWADIPDAAKQKLRHGLAAIPVDEYFTDAKLVDEDTDE